MSNPLSKCELAICIGYKRWCKTRDSVAAHGPRGRQLYLAPFLTYYHFREYVTACDLEKSFNFDMTVELTSHVHFPIYE